VDGGDGEHDRAQADDGEAADGRAPVDDGDAQSSEGDSGEPEQRRVA
jgi:hypothetical protein